MRLLPRALSRNQKSGAAAMLRANFEAVDDKVMAKKDYGGEDVASFCRARSITDQGRSDAPEKGFCMRL